MDSDMPFQTQGLPQGVSNLDSDQVLAMRGKIEDPIPVLYDDRADGRHNATIGINLRVQPYGFRGTEFSRRGGRPFTRMSWRAATEAKSAGSDTHCPGR
jgi:hypothetical protein